MKFKSVFALFVVGLISLAIVSQARSEIIIADTVIDYYNSGAYSGFPTAPYGGTWDGYSGAFPVSVPLSYATDGDANTFVSLPSGSYLTLGFSNGYVFDGPGLDLFISEVGGNNELANIFVSSDFGHTFTLLGKATTDTVSGFDLSSIGYTDHVNAVKIVGLDNFGGSPGFDLAFVKGLEGSVVIDPVPEPVTLTLFSLGLFGIAFMRRQK